MQGQPNLSLFKVFLFCLAIFMASTAMAAEWYKEYETAIDLVRKGRFAEAIPRLQAAIAQKNQEGLNIKFYGMKFDDYFPHYYLGRAHFQQKNFQAALTEFEISNSQGQIQRNSGLFQNLTEMRTLASAQMKIQNPSVQPPVVAEKKPEQVVPKSEPIPAEKRPESEPAIREQPVKTEPATIAKTEPPSPAKPPEITDEQVAEGVNLKRAKSFTKDGARKYFQGEFDLAISSFSSALTLAPQELSAQFLLGCSYAAKYLLSGSQDEASLQKASAAFQKLRRANRNYPLTKSPLISPAVLEIYHKTSGA